MTDFSPSDDELLSSFIDGDLTDEEATRLQARLTAEPELRQRLDALRGASTIAGSPVTPLSSEQSDSMIAAALAVSGTAENVTDLGSARAARSRWLPRAAVVAAGVVLLAVAVPVLGNLDDSDSDSAGESDVALDSTDDSTDSPDQDEMADPTMADSGVDSDTDGDDADSMDMSNDEPVDGAAESDPDPADDLAATMDDERASSFSEVFGSDALQESLGDFSSEGALADEVRLNYQAYRADLGGLAPLETNDPTVSDVRALQAQVGLANCTQDLDDFEAENDVVVAVDYSVAEIGPDTVAIVLYSLEGGNGVGYILDPATCEEIDKVEIDVAG